jgi:hypothetical protein
MSSAKATEQEGVIDAYVRRLVSLTCLASERLWRSLAGCGRRDLAEVPGDVSQARLCNVDIHLDGLNSFTPNCEQLHT